MSEGRPLSKELLFSTMNSQTSSPTMKDFPEGVDVVHFVSIYCSELMETDLDHDDIHDCVCVWMFTDTNVLDLTLPRERTSAHERNLGRNHGPRSYRRDYIPPMYPWEDLIQYQIASGMPHPGHHDHHSHPIHPENHRIPEQVPLGIPYYGRHDHYSHRPRTVHMHVPLRPSHSSHHGRQRRHH